MMITNLFVDASVLAFPPRVDNKQEDCENIKKYLRNMQKLLLIWEKIPNVTISIRNHLESDLAKHGYDFTLDKDQKQRLNAMTTDDPNFNIDPRDISRFYFNIISKDTQSIRFNNHCAIQNIDKNTLQNYRKSACVCTEKFFEDEHKKLISYISGLNEKYAIANSSYIAICGKGQDYQENTVNITRVKKAYERNKNPVPDFDTLEAAYNTAKEETKENIIFGDSIENSPNISIVYKDLYNKQPIPNKIYHYLTTLANVVKRIDNLNADDETINKLVNIFGCNSSSEDKKNNYQNCPYRRWYDGKSESQFILHLKPTTSPYPTTTRIYYKYDKEQKKFVVGMILDHPPNCRPGCDGEMRCSDMYTIGSVMQEKTPV